VLEFRGEGATAVQLIFHQPNDAFIAKRVGD